MTAPGVPSMEVVREQLFQEARQGLERARATHCAAVAAAVAATGDYLTGSPDLGLAVVRSCFDRAIAAGLDLWSSDMYYEHCREAHLGIPAQALTRDEVLDSIRMGQAPGVTTSRNWS
jgi:hypothetical protein